MGVWCRSGAKKEQGWAPQITGAKEAWLPKAAELSHCLPATCSFDHFPLGLPRSEMAALLIQPPHTFCTAHFFPWIVFLLPAVFQYRLCHHLLPNASSLLAPQLVTPGPILQNCPLWELLHRSASNKNRNPCQFCISWIISYVSRFCVVLDCLLLWLFTVLRVFSNKPFRLFYYEECCKSKALMHFFFFFF